MKSIFFLITAIVITQLVSAQDWDELNNQAFTERDNKNYQKALELCNQALSKKTNARSYIIRADCWFYMDKYQNAIDDYTSSLSYYTDYYGSDNKEKAGIYYFRGMSKQFLYRYNDAISDFNTALTYNYRKPGNIYWSRANCYFNLSKYKDAANDYSSAISNLSDSKDISMLYKYKGDCLANLGTYEAAFSSYATSVSYNPDFYDAFWQRGYYKYFLGKYDEAIDDYNKAIIIVEATGSSGNKIDLASLYNTKANILIAQKKQSVAIAAIGKAIEIDPNNVTYYSTSAALYKQMKDFTKAQVEYEKAITVETDNKKKSSLYLNRSMMEWSYLDYASCLKDINKAIESDPENGMNFWHRSIVNGYKKNYTMAIKDCNTALELYKNDSIYTPSLYWLRADHKTRSGDYKGAMDDYRLYAKYYPESYSIYYELGRLYKKKLKNMDLANANLAKAARLAWEAKDTSKYCYIKVIEGDKIEPFKLQTDQILNSLTDDYQYKWELHNMACLYSLSGNVAKGLEYLEKSMEAGFDDYLHLVNDRDLELLMKQPRWKTFLSKYKMPLVKQ